MKKRYDVFFPVLLEYTDRAVDWFQELYRVNPEGRFRAHQVLYDVLVLDRTSPIWDEALATDFMQNITKTDLRCLNRLELGKFEDDIETGLYPQCHDCLVLYKFMFVVIDRMASRRLKTIRSAKVN